MRRAAALRRTSASLSLLATSVLAVAAIGAGSAPAIGLATLRVAETAGPVERLLDGTVEAVNQTTVSAQTSGRIVAINVDVNDYVPAGTVILRIRSTEQVAGLTQAQAALKEATAREAEAQTHYDRIYDMYQRRVVAKATLDEASATRDAAVARLIAARAGLDSAQEGVSYTEVRAPYSGVVTQKFIQLGQSVAPGTPLMAGASLDELRVVAEVPQSVIDQVRKIRKAAVYVNGRRIETTDLTLYPAAQPGTNTFRVWIGLPKGVQGLAPGMFVKVGLVTGDAATPAAAAERRGREKRDACGVRRRSGRARDAAPGPPRPRARRRNRDPRRPRLRGNHRPGSGRRRGCAPASRRRSMTEKLGFSGRVAQLFLDSELTPLIGLTALLLGLFAVAVTPREEEPQINVTMANVIVPFPGASAQQVENLVATPMEKVLAEISGVKHIYSVSRPGVAVVTVQFEVGEDRTDAIVRLYNAIYSNQDWRPPGLGVLQPLVKPKGIDDVPILGLTLWTKDPTRGGHELRQVAHAIEPELKRVSGTRNVYTIGGPDETVHVTLDPQRLAGYGLTVSELAASLQAANVVQHAGSLVANGADVPVQAGEFLADRDQVAQLVVSVHEGRPVYLQDVATVNEGPDQPEQYVTLRRGAGLDDRRRLVGHVARRDDRDLEEARRERDRRHAVGARAGRAASRHLHSGRRRGHRHARLRRDGQRQGAEADPEARVRHGFGGAAGVADGRLARGGRGRRRGDRHAGGDALRILGVGLHDQPRIALRAHLRDRHPRGRRDRGGREHPSTHGVRHRGLERNHPARRGRGGRSHDPRDLHRDRGAAADGVRIGTHGAVHEPDPDQRQHGHADLARASRWCSRRGCRSGCCRTRMRCTGVQAAAPACTGSSSG